MIQDSMVNLNGNIETFRKVYNENREFLGHKAIIKLLLLEYINYSIKVYRINKLSYEDKLMYEYTDLLHNKLMYVFKTDLVINEEMSNYILTILYDINQIVCDCYKEFFDFIEFKVKILNYIIGICVHMNTESELNNISCDTIEENILNILEEI